MILSKIISIVSVWWKCYVMVCHCAYNLKASMVWDNLQPPSWETLWLKIWSTVLLIVLSSESEEENINNVDET